MSDVVVYGTEESETLNGTSQKDTIYGYGGNDTIYAGDQDDIIYGGYGDDLIYASWGANRIDGGYGTDRLVVEGLRADHDIFVDGNTIMIGGPGKWNIVRNVEWILFSPPGQAVEHFNVNAYLAAHYNHQWDNFVSATEGEDWVAGSDGNDRLQGDGGEDVFYGGLGDDAYFGGGYIDQVHFDGVIADYVIKEHSDGSVTFAHAIYGTDTLHAIRGLLFLGNQEWISVAEAVKNYAISEHINVIFASDTHLMNDGTSGDDRFEGNDNENHFRGWGGDDVYYGKGGYDQVNYDGAAADYQIFENVDGSVVIASAATGTDTLYGIEGAWFNGEAKWYSIADLVANHGSNPGVNVIYASTTQLMNDGTSGDDRFEGNDNENHFRGWGGDDVYYGRGGYDQVDYDGSPWDYDISVGVDGSVVIAGAATGTDTLYGIEGAWFNGEAKWYSIQNLVDTYGGGGTNPDLSPFDAADYGQALNLSMQFYYAQYSGDLPTHHPISWRGDSALNDGQDVGRDLTGGWYDAGDHVKFGLPMAWSATVLAWGALDNGSAYQQAGAGADILNHLEWVSDYFLRAYDDKGTASLADDVFYAQVGDPYADHAYWGAPEDMTMARPSYAVTALEPGTEVTAETAAAMAAISMVMREAGNIAYADLLLDQAEKLYAFSETYQGSYNDSVPNIGEFYRSYSGYNDELAWAASWLHKATGDAAYLSKAEALYWGQTDVFSSWENKWMGTAVLLAEQTGNTIYFSDLAQHLDWAQNLPHTPGTPTNDGLIWDANWGSNRYAANTAFLAVQHAQTLMTNGASPNDAQVKELFDFAADQIDYTLGDNPDSQSYLVGFGSNYPLNPHHRAASGMDGWVEFESAMQNEHILYGALVGGPDINGNWNDDRTDHISTEVSTDYNAAYSSVLAALIDYDLMA